MANRTLGMALASWCLSGSLALAQFGLPGAGCSSCGPEGCGTPGPMNSLNAPPGPGEDYSLPADLANAFDQPKCDNCCEWFVTAGAIALMRDRMGQSALATNGQGIIAVEFDDMQMNFNLGPRLAAGVIWGNQAIELSGFYIPAHDSSITTTDAGMQTFFFNTQGPLGQPNSLVTTLTTSIGNYELNYRTWSAAFTGPQLIFGCRFLDLQERLAILGRDGAGNEETYTARTFNRIVGPTVGIEYGIPLGCSAALSMVAKGTWGWNISSNDVSLNNGGTTVSAQDADHSFFSHVYETGIYFDMWVADPIHLRLGCQTLWALHVAEAVKQINFNAVGPSIGDSNGSIFYWGPVAELQFVW